VFGESAVQVPIRADQEPNSLSSALVSRDELRYRLLQQSLLGEFGRIAMQTRDLRKIL
jgi:two-component system, sensor histidine kinase PdtaS